MTKLINILLVEDDYLDQVEVQRALNKKSILYRMKIASNGEIGLEMLKEKESDIYSGPPDIILLDLNMPRMNGFEFLEALRNDPVNKDIKVFALTTSEEKEDREAAKKLGVSGFITKPLKLDSPPSIDAFNLMIDLMNLQN